MVEGPAEPPPPRQSRLLPLLLTALVAFGPMSIDLFLPSLPDMTRIFATSVSRIQLTLSVFIGGFAVAQLLCGPLSDRFGRKPVLLGGITLYLLASLGCLVAPDIHSLLLGRLLQALGACAGPVVSRAIVRDLYPRDQAARILASMAAAMAVAPALAPTLGGLLHAAFGWHACFAVMALFGAILLPATFRLLHETNRHPDRRALSPWRMLETYHLLLHDRAFVGQTLTLTGVFSALFSFVSAASFIVIDLLGVRPQFFGLCFLAVVGGFLSGNLFSAHGAARLGMARTVRLGVVLSLLAAAMLLGLALAGIQTLAAVLAPMAVVFLSAGLIIPNCTALAISPHARIAGSASALLGFLQMAIAAVAGWIVGAMNNGTTLPMAAVVATTITLGGLVYWGLGRKHGEE